MPSGRRRRISCTGPVWVYWVKPTRMRPDASRVVADRKRPAQFVPHSTSGPGSSMPSSLVAVEIRPSPENEGSSVRSGQDRASALEPWSCMVTTADSPSTETRGTETWTPRSDAMTSHPRGSPASGARSLRIRREPYSTVHTAPDGVAAHLGRVHVGALRDLGRRRREDDLAVVAVVRVQRPGHRGRMARSPSAPTRRASPPPAQRRSSCAAGRCGLSARHCSWRCSAYSLSSPCSTCLIDDCVRAFPEPHHRTNSGNRRPPANGSVSTRTSCWVVSSTLIVWSPPGADAA